MAQFGADGRCLMRVLQEELDDPEPADCGVCSVCTAPRFDGPLDPELVRDAALHLRSKPLLIEVKKMAPDAEGKMKKLADDVRPEEGRALARLGDGGWDPLVQAGRRDGRFDDELVEAAAEAVRTWRPSDLLRRRRAVAALRRAGPRLRGAARRVRSACRSSTRSSASATTRRSARWPTPPSRSRTCAASSACPATLEGGGLLVDDIRFSGWTLAMVARPAAPPGRRGGLPVRALDGLLSSFSHIRLWRTLTSPNAVPPVITIRGAPGARRRAHLVLELADRGLRLEVDVDALGHEQVDLAEQRARVDADLGLGDRGLAQVEPDRCRTRCGTRCRRPARPRRRSA